MARNTLGALLAIFAIGCGGGDTTAVDDGGGGKDATKESSLTFPSDGGDAADVYIDSGPPCAPGDFYLTMVDDAGTTKLTTGCGDAAAPYITANDPCMDCLGLHVSACGAGESFQLDSLGVPGGPGMYTSSASATVTDADGGQRGWGVQMVTYWPSSGNTVKGDYTAVAGPGVTMSGHFCLMQQ